MGKLTASQIKNLKFTGTPTKHFDGDGLYLHLTDNARTWKYAYRIGGKQKTYTIGSETLYKLAEARQQHQDAYKLCAQGVDPVVERKRKKAQLAAEQQQTKQRSVTVRDMTEKWFRLESKTKDWKLTHANKVFSRFQHISNSMNDRSITDVTAEEIHSMLNAVANRGKIDTAHRLKSYLRGIFNLAIIDDVIKANIVDSPKITLPKRPAKTALAHITDSQEYAKLLVAIDSYTGSRSVEAAIRLLPMLFVRPGELRGMRWDELDFELGQWKLPAGRMKMNREHTVSLPSQALAILEYHRDYSDGGEFVFPGASRSKPISDATLGKALRSIGYSGDQIVPHGFRHTASTFLNERKFLVDGQQVKFSADAIEYQLAHVQGGVRSVYNMAQYSEERTAMMQAWADWLDELKTS